MLGALALDRTSDVGVAQAVLAAEAAGLRALSAGLDERFSQAVERLGACSGRVVVSGMGKSGHVGRKIAATFASTGTPAIFVHPAEASHGDLGMIVAGDAVLALSNSGETAELADLIAHAHRFGLPLIAITGRPASALARASDVVLALPAAPEACPLGLAPTTSTTMQLALGDALAVALLTRRGFTPSEFSAFHPGGKLGSQLRLVRDLMHEGDAVPLAPVDLSMDRALLIMTGKGFGCLGAVGPGGQLVGVLTDGDLRRAMGPDLLQRRVQDVMNPNPRTIAADALAADALRAMNHARRPVTSLFVVDAGRRPEGILHVHDLLRAGVA
jgi:arabinose-5-phosphate isomerase